MNYYGAAELAESFRVVRGNTLVIAREIPEEKYEFRAAEGIRSVGELLAHLAVASKLQTELHAAAAASDVRGSFAGFDLRGLITRVLAEEKEARSKDELLTMLRESGERWAAAVAGFSEEFLAERVTFPAGAAPPSKTRFEMVLGVKEHEMHHRGQLMVMQRMMGIVPHLTRALEVRNREIMK